MKWKLTSCDFLVTLIDAELLDQYQYLDNCPPTPSLTQQQSIEYKSGLILG